MPRLSIVIPWVGPTGPFEDTLACVLQHRPGNCEVLVALAAPYDDPYELSGEVTFLPPSSGDGSLVALVNQGIAAASAPIVQVVTCGLSVTEGWTTAALLHFDDPQISAVAPVIVTPQRRDRVAALGLNLSPGGAKQAHQRGKQLDAAALVHARPLAAPLSGGFFRKEVVEALGGFDEQLGLHAADLDFTLCARELGLATECEPASVLVSESRVDDDGSFAAGSALERLFWRHLAREERGARMPRHYARLGAELAYAALQPRWLAHAAGRTVGWLASFLDKPRDARIAAARERLAAAPQILQLPSRESRRRAA